MSSNWMQATEQYTRSNAAMLVPADKIRDVIQIAQELTTFGNSEDGILSMLLLEASDKVVVFGKDHDESMITFCWGKFGPTVLVPLGRRLRSGHADAITLAQIIVKAGKEPGEVIPWLRFEIDAIARDAHPLVE